METRAWARFRTKPVTAEKVHSSPYRAEAPHPSPLPGNRGEGTGTFTAKPRRRGRMVYCEARVGEEGALGPYPPPATPLASLGLVGGALDDRCSRLREHARSATPRARWRLALGRGSERCPSPSRKYPLPRIGPEPLTLALSPPSGARGPELSPATGAREADPLTLALSPATGARGTELLRDYAEANIDEARLASGLQHFAHGIRVGVFVS